MIDIKNITKVYGKKSNQFKALDCISLKIDKGDFIAITGPSGSGKSTLLNILGCLDKPTSGEYFIDDKPVNTLTQKEMATIRNKKFGFIVQDFALIDKYTVYQNVILPIKYNNKNKADAKKEVNSLLTKLGILSKANEYSNNLSGGQKQRVAIARALINNPDIIFADEPTGALDQKNGLDVINLLKDINNQGKTVIIVTHDNKIAEQCNKRINIIDGKIESIT